MAVLVRLLFYIQFLLGLGRLAGLVRNPSVWGAHVIIGAAVALLSLLAFRPRTGVVRPGLRAAARLSPLLPLLTGLAILSGAGGRLLTLLHVALAVAALGLVEMAFASERKGPSRGGPS